EDITLYAVWKNKSDASSKITIEDASFPYTGEVQTPEVTLASFTQYTNPTTYFLYYSGTEASRENWLPDAPTDVGVYTVRAIYEDSIYKGYKDAALTITKTGRDLVPTSSLLLLYGKDKSIALRLSDGDNTALSDLTVTSADGSVIAPRTDEMYKDGGLIIVPFSYVGEGYTTVTFSLPETSNYEAASATITVLSKSGYNVTVAAADELGNNAGIVGGSVTADKPTAPAGDVVRLSAQAKPGYTFAGFTVVNDVTGQNVEVENNSFTMPEASVTVSAEFTQNEYALTYTAVDGVTYGDLPTEAHYGDAITLSGSITGNGAIKAYLCAYNGTSFTVTPDQNGVFRFIMPANDVVVTAVAGEWYNVSVSAGISGGSVVTSVSRAFEGLTVKVTPTADAGYTVGSITYTAGGITKPGSVSVGSDGTKIYSIVMPAVSITVNAEFIPDTTLNGAIDSVDDTAGYEIGKNEADIAVNVDDDTAAALKDAASAVDVSLTASGGKNLSDEEKADAIGALAQAGLVSVETDGTNVSVKNTDDDSAAEIRVVEKTYLEVTVKEFAETDDGVLMTLEITPMKQTVATAVPEGTKLGSENSAPLSEAEIIDVVEMTRVTVGIPKAMAIAAGGAGSIVYIAHTHNGVTFEYPAVIEGNDTDGYTATFDNPNGYSEFTVSAQTNTVASFDLSGVTYYYPSFKEAIADALAKNVTSIVMHKMPTGEDYATITKQVTLTFEAAVGSEDKIDFNALYTDWILTDDGIKKSSTPVQLPLHIFVYVKTDTDDYPEDLSFSAASLTLQNNLKVNFYVKKDLIEDNGYESPFAVFVMNGNTVTVREYSEVTSNGVEYYVFSFANIAPNLMNDTITATLHATFEETEYVSEPLEYSVATYCYSMLGRTDDAKLRTLLVDLLNYGAAAQTYTGYNTDALVTANLTAEQIAWGTASDPEHTSVTNARYRTVQDPSVNWAGVSLRLNDSVTMQFVFTTDDTDGVTVRIENGEGTLLKEITAEEFRTSGGYYIAAYNGLTAGQLSETVYATAYRGGEAISNTVAY
ncbi:MAG: hypothetical protein IJQ80_04040, partial [Clostridia bacterium]|nr:hypothetical protein [Clostridia bacterium]